MGIITATTIGFGDKTPKTYFGRIVTIVWMVVGVYFTGLFAAAITSGFITQSLADSSGQATLKMVRSPPSLATPFCLASEIIRPLVGSSTAACQGAQHQ